MIQDHERKIIRLEAKVEMLEASTARLEDELKVYQAATIGQNKKLDALLAAIVGDETMKTTGIMQRLDSIESVTNFVKEWKLKAAGALVLVGWAWAFGGWVIDHLDKILK